MSIATQVEGDAAVYFRLPSGDELSVWITEDGTLQINTTANRGNLLVLPSSNNSINIVTAHLPKELGRRRVDLLLAPLRKIPRGI